MEIRDNKNEDIELRSEEFQEVLGEVPGWLLRWGIILVASIIALLLIGSSIFKYPEVISSSMVLTGTSPVASVVAKTSGKLQMLFIKDNQYVSKGQILAVIDNPAHTKDVWQLEQYLKSISSLEDLHNIPPQNLVLGDMQIPYASFCLTIAEYLQFKQLNYYPQKIAFIRKRIEQNKILYQDCLRQEHTIEKTPLFLCKQQRTDSVLPKDLSPYESLNHPTSQHIQNQFSTSAYQTHLQNIATTLMQTREELLDAENQYADSRRALETRLNNCIVQLTTSIQHWESTYVLKAPIDGIISFTNYWSENQNIAPLEEIFAIIPIEQGEIIGKSLLPVARSGKVKKGQKVNISFQNFPENEFGIVRGVVENISLIPVEINNPKTGYREASYIVDIRLPNGLKTSYGKILPFQPQMRAQADIITDNISLLERLFLPVKKMWKNGMDSSF